MKSLRAPRRVETVSVLPLLTIFSFSLFVVWQWCIQPFDPSAVPSVRDAPEATLPADAFARRSDSPDASGHGVVGNADLRMDEAIGGEEDRCCRCALDEIKWERAQRTAPLIHGWSDKELIARAVGKETSNAMTPFSARTDCMHTDPATYDMNTEQRRGAPRIPCTGSCGGNPGTARAKIAFLFMITTALPFEPLWKKYFAGKEGLYNIYVHADPFNASLFTPDSGVFYNRLIPSGKATRGSPSLVLASQRLLANAMLDDPLNHHFALVSGHCVPIRSFDYGYRMVTSSKQSFIEVIKNETVMLERYRGREGGESVMLPEITFEQFRKAAQWYVLLRKHAFMVLQDQFENKYWSKFDHPCVIYFCGTDEHYYPTLINILDPEGTNGKCVTFVNWPPWVSEHPLMFQRYEIKKELIEDLQRRDGGQYLFARKFQEDTVDLLMELSDTILQ